MRIYLFLVVAALCLAACASPRYQALYRYEAPLEASAQVCLQSCEPKLSACQSSCQQRHQACLKEIEPYPPYHFYHLGREAIAVGDFRRAREWLTQEVKRAPYQHEFQFWLAVAQFSLGEFDAADRHMMLAMEYSPTRLLQGRYAEKLERLRNSRLQ